MNLSAVKEWSPEVEEGRGAAHRPGKRIPEAMHSMTRRRASPGPNGRLQVAKAFSQISSSGYRGQIETPTLSLEKWLGHLKVV